MDVDAVLLVIEHGDYPVYGLGQILDPRMKYAPHTAIAKFNSAAGLARWRIFVAADGRRRNSLIIIFLTVILIRFARRESGLGLRIRLDAARGRRLHIRLARRDGEARREIRVLILILHPLVPS